MNRKPAQYRRILEYKNAKTIKGESLGWLTGILYLAPANEAGAGVNMCPMATDGCRRDCLFTAGRGIMNPVRTARVSKTLYLLQHREAFLQSLRYDIAALVRKAGRMGLRPCVRINGTSDQPWIALQMASEFPDVQFYDYTKLPRPWQRVRSNYHITFSHSEHNMSDCMDALQHGISVAVVFDTKKGEPLPDEWMGYPVFDGDTHDLRFLDPKRSIIGVRAKGAARKDTTSGFVVLAAEIRSALPVAA